MNINKQVAEFQAVTKLFLFRLILNRCKLLIVNELECF